MKKLMTLITVTLVLLMAFTANSFAMSESDFVEYVSKAYEINGATFQITQANKRVLQNYLKDHPITEEQADKMKEKFDNIVAFVDSTNAKHINYMTKEQKQRLLALGNEMASVVGVTLTYNKTDRTIEFYKDGVLIIAISEFAILGQSSLVQTGSANYEYLVVPAVLAVAVLAIGGIALPKKLRA